MKQRLGIIGVGSAGIVNLCYFLSTLSNEWEVVSIYDPSVPILGIGESTNPGFITILEHGLKFDFLDDGDQLEGTIKFGSKFMNWREKDWLNPFISGNIAIHFNNYRLKEFAFSRFPTIWGDKFKVIEGYASDIKNNFENVQVKIGDTVEEFDYIIDCSGFPKDFTEYEPSTCTLINRCIVHDVKDFDAKMYTDHTATKHGWMFGIPLTTRKTYGYLFNDQITPIEEAKADMADLLGLQVENLELRHFEFKSYYAKQLVQNRVLKNGNRLVFFEPISALSLNQYIASCHILFDYITRQISESDANAKYMVQTRNTEDMINYYYHGGSLFDTEFWRQASTNAKYNLAQSMEFRRVVAISQRATAMGLPFNGPPHIFTSYSLAIMDEAFEYNYFKGSKFLWDNDE